MQAHTLYIEDILQTENAANVLLTSPLPANFPTEAEQRTESLKSDNSPMHVVTAGKVNNIINSYNGGGTSTFYKKRQSVGGGSVSFEAPTNSTSAQGATNNSLSASKRLCIFLKDDEELLLSGLATKPNPVGIQLMRELIWTSGRRLIYIDPKTLELKGEIKWLSNEPHPKVKQVGDIILVTLAVVVLAD